MTPNSIPTFLKNFEKRKEERRKIFGIGKYVFLWRRLKTEKKIYFFAVKKKNREGKGGKYLEKISPKSVKDIEKSRF